MKEYLKAEMDIIAFDTEDVIGTSGPVDPVVEGAGEGGGED